jgi:hypothetical protein
MIRNIIRLLVLSLIVHAGVRIGPIFWHYLQLKDAVVETAMFAGRKTPEALVERVVALADEHGVILAPREITVVRDGEITYITTGYTKQLEYLPTRFYPWQFTIDIESEPPRYGKLIP